MTDYTLYDETNAPEGARKTLEGAKKAYGFIPNLLAAMAEAPSLAKAYVSVSKLYDGSSFSPVERQVVLLAASFENECEY